MKNASYQASGIIVVTFQKSFYVAAPSVRAVHELPRLFKSEIDVVAAASPLPLAVHRQVLASTRQSSELPESTIYKVITQQERNEHENRFQGSRGPYI